VEGSLSSYGFLQCLDSEIILCFALKISLNVFSFSPKRIIPPPSIDPHTVEFERGRSGGGSASSFTGFIPLPFKPSGGLAKTSKYEDGDFIFGTGLVFVGTVVDGDDGGSGISVVVVGVVVCFFVNGIAVLRRESVLALTSSTHS